eukprot:scpid87086/ scgid17135/ 
MVEHFLHGLSFGRNSEQNGRAGVVTGGGVTLAVVCTSAAAAAGDAAAGDADLESTASQCLSAVTGRQSVLPTMSPVSTSEPSLSLSDQACSAVSVAAHATGSNVQSVCHSHSAGGVTQAERSLRGTTDVALTPLQASSGLLPPSTKRVDCNTQASHNTSTPTGTTGCASPAVSTAEVQSGQSVVSREGASADEPLSVRVDTAGGAAAAGKDLSLGCVSAPSPAPTSSPVLSSAAATAAVVTAMPTRPSAASDVQQSSPSVASAAAAADTALNTGPVAGDFTSLSALSESHHLSIVKRQDENKFRIVHLRWLPSSGGEQQHEARGDGPSARAKQFELVFQIYSPDSVGKLTDSGWKLAQDLPAHKLRCKCRLPKSHKYILAMRVPSQADTSAGPRCSNIVIV